MIERRIKQQVTDALDRQAAVALIGPRQVGKTTLAQEIGEERGALYLDLEEREDRAKLEIPALFLEKHEHKLVILDEIHRVPGLFQTLRGLTDKGRRKGLRTGRKAPILVKAQKCSRSTRTRSVFMFAQNMSRASVKTPFIVGAHSLPYPICYHRTGGLREA